MRYPDDGTTVSGAVMMADRLTTRINRLKRERRSLRKWAAVELWLGILVVGIVAAGVVWLWQAKERRNEATESVAERRVEVAPPDTAVPGRRAAGSGAVGLYPY